MSHHRTREEAVDHSLIPALRAIGVDPETVDLEAIARRTVRRSGSFSHAPTWHTTVSGEALRRIAEEHSRE
ncbi:hypothetical protein [Agrococcus carbonis]|uniref:Uncharacterized protein n=1 Tax=Agrococcus carbonis TaxID=684552 RepID=A0A1H1MEF4_9MICO|nr:hypothetical protein [Agrococcus carbonis]SDR85020.1 hypothetical protein SAMN04489719_0949 [Agrococcus carbonis]